MLLDGYWTIKPVYHLETSVNEGKGSTREKIWRTEKKESRNMLIFRGMSKEKEVVHLVGLEPATFWSVARRSIQLSYRCA